MLTHEIDPFLRELTSRFGPVRRLSDTTNTTIRSTKKDLDSIVQAVLGEFEITSTHVVARVGNSCRGTESVARITWREQSQLVVAGKFEFRRIVVEFHAGFLKAVGSEHIAVATAKLVSRMLLRATSDPLREELIAADILAMTRGFGAMYATGHSYTDGPWFQRKRMSTSDLPPDEIGMIIAKLAQDAK